MHYSDYVEFYKGKIAEIGPERTLNEAFPFLVDGCTCGLFHSEIQLGCFFETGDPQVLAEGCKTCACRSLLDLQLRLVCV